MALALRYAARSDVGLIRDGNEDSAYAGPRLLVVADGMGGAAAGEVASSVAVATMSQLDEDYPGPDLLDRLATAVRKANEHLHDMVLGDPDLEGMGTTLTALLRAGSRFGLVHVGDSRGYLLRDGVLTQITHDHTFVQSLVDEGRITAEEAAHHPQRSVITNVLDGRPEVDLDLSVREARAGDRYLLCSDGLSGVVSEETMRDALVEAGDPREAVERLVDLALRGGGPDNITAIVADVVDVDAGPPSAIPLVVGAAAEGPDGEGGNGSTNGTHAAAKAAAIAPRPAPHAERGDREAAEPVRRGGRRALRTGLVLLLALGLVGAGGWAAYGWSQRQYFVGASGDEVAIFRGINQDAGPIDLSRVQEDVGIPLGDLPSYSRDKVREGISAESLAAAQRTVTTLREQAAACVAARAPASPGPTPTATTPPAPVSPTPAPRATGTSAPAATPTPTPTASPTTPPAGCEEPA